MLHPAITKALLNQDPTPLTQMYGLHHYDAKHAMSSAVATIHFTHGKTTPENARHIQRPHGV